jgi:hypothetical protein
MCEPSGRTAGSAATVFSVGTVPLAVILPVQYAVAVNDDPLAGRFGAVLLGPRRPAHPSTTRGRIAKMAHHSASVHRDRDRSTNKRPAVHVCGGVDGTESTLAFSVRQIKLSGYARRQEKRQAGLEKRRRGRFTDETCSRPQT